MIPELSNAEAEIVRVTKALGAAEFGGALSAAEKALLKLSGHLPEPTPAAVRAMRSLIREGHDPLGDLFLAARNATTRRGVGAIYTPAEIVVPMVKCILEQNPRRVVDAGTGSGRFMAEVARTAPDIKAIAVDTDPLATLMSRATLSTLGAGDVRVKHADYMSLRLPPTDGVTAFIGNPPYVRHHELSPATKAWAQNAAASLGLKISGLAGLHAYFFLATAAIARPGDVGCFVTSAEWLDVNYGSAVRELLLGILGGEAVHVLEPETLPFEGTATTAVIVNFHPGTKTDSIRFRPVKRLADLGNLAEAGDPVVKKRVAEAVRWSVFVRTRSQVPSGHIELGELCRVHRGAVTGSNATWVVKDGVELPDSVLYPSVTKARELFQAGEILRDTSDLRRVVDIPVDLDELCDSERKIVEQFIRRAKRASVHKGYIAAHRRAWWSVGLRDPAPILATYMARRVPAFVMNPVEARHINIAHGLYPRQPMSKHALSRLSHSLRHSISLSQGRVYAGGLTKFEPKEMERLPIPDLATLMSRDPLPTEVDPRAVGA